MTDSNLRISRASIFWLAFLLFASLALLLFARILLPFAAGFVLAYLFHPVVDRLNRAGLPRGAGAFAMILLAALTAGLFLSLILPPLIDQLTRFVQDFPGYYERAHAYLMEHYGHYLKTMTEPQKPGSAPGEVQQQIAPWLAAQLQGLIKGSLALFDSLALFFLTPVVTFFLLRDWDKMIASIEGLLPRKQAPVIKQLACEIDVTLAGYLRGTLIVLLIVSTFYMVTLGLIGLNYGLLIGLCAGLISFVPYLGSSSGFLISGGVALSQYWPDYTQVALVCGVFVFGQLMEGNVLTPNIVGNKVGLHPLWLLFALLASGSVLGFTGLLISVPLAASIGVLVRHAIRRYYDSPMYDRKGIHEHSAGTHQA